MRRSSSAVGVVKKHTMRGKTRTPSVPHSLTSMDSIHRKTSTTAGDAVPMAVGGGTTLYSVQHKKWGSVRVNDNSCYASCTLVCFFGPHDRLLPLPFPPLGRALVLVAGYPAHPEELFVNCLTAEGGRKPCRIGGE